MITWEGHGPKMSQSRNKKQPDSKKRNYDEDEQRKRKGGRHIKWFRVISLIAALTILITVLSLGFNIFGKVDFSSKDYKYSARTTDSAAVSSPTTAAAAAQTTTAGTVSSGASSAASGDHYIQPAGTDWNLKLVNPWNALDSSYQIPLTTISGDNQYDNRAADKLKELISAGSAYNIRPCSLYRSIDLQTKLFNNEVKKVKKPGESEADAEKDAATWVARPWTSEHNLGLAADLLFGNYSSLETSYENTDAYKWMLAHCADYGFILRYPKDKVSVTGVQYEPWHYRYVGEDAAHEIMSRGITLEEYLQEKGI